MVFTPNVPSAGQTLGGTQDAIKDNFNTINTTISVDHVAMNAANQGMHAQVQLPNINVPARPVAQATLFTDTSRVVTAPGTNLKQLFFYPAAAADAQSTNQYISTYSSLPGATYAGSTYLFGGIILKWGRLQITDPSGINTFSFSSSFPNSCFTVNTTNSTFNSIPVVPTAFTAGGFTVSGPLLQTFNYIAIGN